MSQELSRRSLLGAAVSSTAILGLESQVHAAEAPSTNRSRSNPFRLCLNTSTIRGQKLPLSKSVEIAARAGFQGIEPWLDEIDRFEQEGGKLSELARQISDVGLVVESAIAFPEWIVDDPSRRAKGLENAKRAMEKIKQLGGMRIAAPPAGATDVAGFDLLKAAERYAALLKAGDDIGVIPQLEVWGFSKTLGRLGEAAFVIAECGHPRATVLTDIYHLHKGGSGYTGLKTLHPKTMFVMHANDYPDLPRADLTDAHRVYPGDGVAPMADILRSLRDAGFEIALSLEVFNREYWKQDPLEVARTGVKKLQAAIDAL